MFFLFCYSGEKSGYYNHKENKVHLFIKSIFLKLTDELFTAYDWQCPMKNKEMYSKEAL